MEFIIKQIIYSVGMLLIGLFTYHIVIRLIEYPGSKKIERQYETAEEKRDRIRRRKSVTKVYSITLILLVLAINIIMYYLIR